MNLTLTRTDKEVDGVFGVLTDEAGKQIAVTLEHAYDAKLGDGSYTAKLSSGTYTCMRGIHRLENKIPFNTFEVMKVPDFNGKKVTGILFHAGNYNEDSKGCILLGRRIAPRPGSVSETMITSSKNTFNAFMDLQKGLSSFTLTVKD